MFNLLLVRHGQTEWNLIRRFQGVTDVPLNNKGKKQAEKISKRLSNYRIDAIYSSPLKRAYSTADEICKYHELEIKTDDRLMEVNFGPWEGRTKEEILSMGYEEEYNNWRNAPEEFNIPEQGNMHDVQKKAMTFIDEMFEECKGKKNILIVAHGAVLKLIVLSLLKMDISFYKNFWLGNASLSIVKKRNNRCTIDLLNDMCHLHERRG